MVFNVDSVKIFQNLPKMIIFAKIVSIFPQFVSMFLYVLSNFDVFVITNYKTNVFLIDVAVFRAHLWSLIPSMHYRSVGGSERIAVDVGHIHIRQYVILSPSHLLMGGTRWVPSGY